jgi:hypothetical protein
MARVLERTGSTTVLTTLAAALVIGCAPSTSSTRTGSAVDTSDDAYLCCTLRFNRSREASDANYDYRDKIVFPAGTRVRVFRMTSTKAEFVPQGDPNPYSIEFRYGRKAMQPGSYFGRLFVADDPLARLPDKPSVRDAVREGRLLVGMTKDEALMARGYPPAHHTPSIEADEWLYYSHYKLCEQVRFVDGRLASIEQVPPPH